MRDVEPGDVDAYVRMRCDPVMMADLGGPLPRAGVEEKVARDVRAAAAASSSDRSAPCERRTTSPSAGPSSSYLCHTSCLSCLFATEP